MIWSYNIFHDNFVICICPPGIIPIYLSQPCFLIFWRKIRRSNCRKSIIFLAHEKIMYQKVENSAFSDWYWKEVGFRKQMRDRTIDPQSTRKIISKVPISVFLPYTPLIEKLRITTFFTTDDAEKVFRHIFFFHSSFLLMLLLLLYFFVCEQERELFSKHFFPRLRRRVFVSFWLGKVYY